MSAPTTRAVSRERCLLRPGTAPGVWGCFSRSAHEETPGQKAETGGVGAGFVVRPGRLPSGLLLLYPAFGGTRPEGARPTGAKRRAEAPKRDARGGQSEGRGVQRPCTDLSGAGETARRESRWDSLPPGGPSGCESVTRAVLST